jgi:hypothetical protein
MIPFIDHLHMAELIASFCPGTGYARSTAHRATRERAADEWQLKRRLWWRRIRSGAKRDQTEGH